jgi:hypothetical protein
LRVGIIGTGAIAAKHAAAYRNIGFQITACTNQTAAKGMALPRRMERSLSGVLKSLPSSTRGLCRPLHVSELSASRGWTLRRSWEARARAEATCRGPDHGGSYDRCRRICRDSIGVVSQHRKAISVPPSIHLPAASPCVVFTVESGIAASIMQPCANTQPARARTTQPLRFFT